MPLSKHVSIANDLRKTPLSTLAGLLFMFMDAAILGYSMHHANSGNLFPSMSSAIVFCAIAFVAAGLITGEGLKGVSAAISAGVSGVAGGVFEGAGKAFRILRKVK